MTIGVAVIAILAMLLLIFGNQIAGKMETKVEYTEFLQQVEDQQIESANIDKESGRVEYKLKDDNHKYYTNYPYTDTFIEDLLKSGVDIDTPKTSWLEYFFKYGAMPVMVLAMFYFLHSVTKLGMNNFVVEPVTSIKTRFSDIAGLDEIKEDMLVLSDMMKNKAYADSGAKIPKGILLQGPPGNGKTLLARAFAGETGVNFIAVNACDFGSQYVGVGSSKIKKVFAAAKRNTPCVVFIDELDSVGAKRGTASDSAGKEMNTMLTALLNQIDGFEPMDNVMVLAATNRVGDLDEALIRPGRFDRQFIIDYPDKNARIDLFKLYTKNIKLAEDIDFQRLSTRTYGYSCSKIATVVNEAVILSVKYKQPCVTMQNFDEAILHMDIKGRLKKTNSQTEEERNTVAYHEAGHAIVSYFATKEEVATVTIRPTTTGAGGFTLTESKEESYLKPINDYRNRLLMLYGGRAAEVILKGSIEEASAGASSDIQQATQLAASYVSIKEGIDFSAFGELGTKQIMKLAQELLQNAWTETLEIVKEHWKYVETVAEELLRSETISKEEFEEVIEKTKQEV